MQPARAAHHRRRGLGSRVGLWLGLLVAAPAAAAGFGWRIDGSSVATGATPPAAWDEAWRVPTARWGNASPVVVGGQVCVTLETTTLACFDAATGAERWRFPHEVIHALPPAEREGLVEKLALADRLEAERVELLKERSRLQRAVRSGDAEAAARVEALGVRLDEARRVLDEVSWARTAADRDIMGYATPTPVSDGRSLWAFFGNGVVARHDLDGRLRWMRWLGRPPGQMKGYDRGVAASPLLADGVLIVAHDAVYGLDPATGDERWRLPGWRDFGTPAVARVGGRAFVALPDGTVLRASDGAVVARELADPYYVGPHAIDDVVVWIGGHAVADNMARGHVPAVAWRLHPQGDGVRPERLWHTELPATDLFYTAPVLHEGRLFSVSRTAELRVLSMDTGEVLHVRDLLSELGGFVYASPTIVGDRLVVGSERGTFLELATSGAYQVLATHRVAGQHRATPAFVDDRIYLRPLEALVCVGCTP